MTRKSYDEPAAQARRIERVLAEAKTPQPVAALALAARVPYRRAEKILEAFAASGRACNSRGYWSLP